ncbi:uncharacterized protein KY384_002810 [Bacidia gigantensis]|uniref:uncharacterized protein n=1 Tax=Bacidia gigantensis TaxID=2732470 RepID=UPI001D055D5D|nr:uncharacterized protein KY384_002810 [Bacidia gigantensis]KAG8532932.1 hypothetical protein KY384_002810 [Bacidia gigantensis]
MTGILEKSQIVPIVTEILPSDIDREAAKLGDKSQRLTAVQPSARFEADTVSTALHVLDAERDAVANLSHIYRFEESARKGLADAINAVAKLPGDGGRLIVTGVGKRGKIAEKCVATMNSLGVRSSFLHPVEAMHGDLGMIGPQDIVLIITYSGRTPELVSMLPHIPQHLLRIVISGYLDSKDCPLRQAPSAGECIFLPAPIPVSETQSFGIAAPTISTTVALVLTDALALATSRILHMDPQAAFRKNHPGGAIGKGS